MSFNHQVSISFRLGEAFKANDIIINGYPTKINAGEIQVLYTVSYLVSTYPSIYLLNVDTIIEGLTKSKEFLNNNFKMELVRVGHYREKSKEYVTECNQTLLYVITTSTAAVAVIAVVVAIRCACKKLVIFCFLHRREN